MFSRTKHSRTLWELYFRYLKSPFPGLGQIFQLNYISHDATVPSGLMMFSGRWNMRYLLSREVSGYRKYWYYTAVRNCYAFSKHVFSGFSQQLSFFSWMTFYQKSVFSVEKNQYHILTCLVLDSKGKMNLRGAIPKGLNFQLVSINITSTCYEGSNADLEELKTKPKFCKVLCVLQTKSNTYFLFKPWLRQKMWKNTLFFLRIFLNTQLFHHSHSPVLTWIDLIF